MIKACMQVNDHIWTMTYRINKDNTLEILNFEKEDPDGYMFKEQLGSLDSISELDGRIADKVTINGIEYEVNNKQNVFSYKAPL